MSEARRFWDERYAGAGDDYVFGTAPNRFLERSLKHLEGCGSVLAVADGEGRNSVWLAEQGFTVTATEISPVALAKARKLAAGRRVAVDFVETDIGQWDWPPAAFDAVVGIFIQFVGPDERRRLFADMRRTLKPGGVLLLHGYTPKQLEYRTGGPSAVENLYTPDLLREAFAGMEILDLRAYEEDVDEGRGHSGRSALIDLVARSAAPGAPRSDAQR